MRRPVLAPSASARTASDDHGKTKLGARRHVGELLGIAPATLRNWIEAEERAERPSLIDEADSRSDAAELRRLRQEVSLRQPGGRAGRGMRGVA
jgi:hypothetical protein